MNKKDIKFFVKMIIYFFILANFIYFSIFITVKRFEIYQKKYGNQMTFIDFLLDNK